MMIDISNENGVLRVLAHGSIDTNTAAAFEAELLQACKENPADKIVLDCGDVRYVSSAGLRVLLRTRKLYNTFCLEAVSNEVYEVLEMTGFTEILPVARAMRTFNVDGCEVIGRGAKGTVYRYDEDIIVKVFHDPDSLDDISRERELARCAFVAGVPTAIPYDVVRVGDSYGSVFELLAANSFSRLIRDNPDKFEEYVNEFTDLMKQMHSTPAKESEMPDVKLGIYKRIDTCKKFISEEDYNRFNALVEAVPNPHTMVHCDYHTNNVMMQNGEALLIDMDTLSYGHPVFDLANVYITYVGFQEFDPDDVERFIGFDRKLCLKLWDLFLPRYLDSNDPAYIAAVEDKIRLLSYARMIRHTRHWEDGPRKDAAIKVCAEKIHDLLAKVDSLDF